MDKQDRILKVDLSTGKISVEPLPAELQRKYLGGEGINSLLFWEHFLEKNPGTDPLSPDNVLIAGMGPLGGTGLGGGSKMKFTFKSPAYNIYGDSTIGGDLGTQLRWAGYAHVVITGKAEHPVFMWIHNDDVEIKDARHIWGKNTSETEDIIKKDLGDSDMGIACIGQAGENLVRYASIISRGHRAAGRGGGGCVFGSKNLKAIAARGTRGLKISDPKAFFQAMDDFVSGVEKDRELAEEIMVRYGTLRYTELQNELGFSNYRNCQGRLIPEQGIKNLGHTWYQKNIGKRSEACSAGCFYGCDGRYQIKGDESSTAEKYAGRSGSKPEFGQLNPLGVGCGVMDLLEVINLSKMCDQYGMDTWEIGMGIALLMELREKGVITDSDIKEWTGEPLTLEWGNCSAIEQIIEATALNSNALGQIMQGGVYEAAKKIGDLKDTDIFKYACYGKAGAAHGGSARSWVQMGLACSLSQIGAHHTKGLGLAPMESMMYFDGNADAGDMSATTNLKGAGHAISETLMAIYNSLGICFFLVNRRLDKVPLEIHARAMGAVTGIALTPEELSMAGERTINIQKAFNSRLGLKRTDDTLCERWMNEPVLEGLFKGIKAADYLEPAKDEYYELRGWDIETSLQTKRKLKELDMLDVFEVLEKEGAVIS